MSADVVPLFPDEPDEPGDGRTEAAAAVDVNVWDERWAKTRHESYRSVIEAVREQGDFVVGWGPGGAPLFTASDEVRFESEVILGDDWDERITTMHTPIQVPPLRAVRNPLRVTVPNTPPITPPSTTRP